MSVKRKLNRALKRKENKQIDNAMRSLVRETMNDENTHGLFFIDDEMAGDDYLIDSVPVTGTDEEAWLEAVAFLGEDKAKRTWKELGITIPEIGELPNEEQTKSEKHKT